MITVTVSTRTLRICGHSAAGRHAAIVCASVSTVSLLLKARAYRWSQRKHPKSSSAAFTRERDELDKRAIEHLTRLSVEYPKHVRLRYE